MFKIKLNGNDYFLDAPINVNDLLKKMDIHPLRVAVEINLDIIPKERYANALINEGDQIEVIEFVGGG